MPISHCLFLDMYPNLDPQAFWIPDHAADPDEVAKELLKKK